MGRHRRSSPGDDGSRKSGLRVFFIFVIAAGLLLIYISQMGGCDGTRI